MILVMFFRQIIYNTFFERKMFYRRKRRGLLKAPSSTLFKKLSLSSISLEGDSEGGGIDLILTIFKYNVYADFL
jgi:hypothetical protein